jgi:hypothetical protein
MGFCMIGAVKRLEVTDYFRFFPTTSPDLRRSPIFPHFPFKVHPYMENAPILAAGRFREGSAPACREQAGRSFASRPW